MFENENTDVLEVVTPEKFSLEVERRALQSGETLLKTCSDYAEELGMEAEAAASLIAQALKEKIEAEASKLNLLKFKNTTTQLF